MVVPPAAHLCRHCNPVQSDASALCGVLRSALRKYHPTRDTAGGYALIMVLIVIMTVSLAATVAVRRETLEQQREREGDLLFAGQQFRRALASYAAVPNPNGSQGYPKTLNDLLLDARSPAPLRHLRRIYPDPMTGKADWILETVQGRIVGLHSRSSKAPVKHADFPDGLSSFAQAQSYREWRFLADGISTDAATTQSSALASANPLASPADSAQGPDNGKPKDTTAPADPFAAALAQCSAQYGASIEACYSDRKPGTDPSQCAAGFRALMRDCLSAANPP